MREKKQKETGEGKEREEPTEITSRLTEEARTNYKNKRKSALQANEAANPHNWCLHTEKNGSRDRRARERGREKEQ